MASGATADMDTRWPRWPDGEEGKLALDVVLGLPVDQAFLLLFGGENEMRRTFNEASGDKEYTTTAWMEGGEAVQAAAVGPTPPPLASVAELRAGFLRRSSYSGTMMGSKYRNEELHRLMEAVPGKSYKVMTTVLTTAMHGEKFRPVVLATLRALPDGRTLLQIRTTILFIIKPNGFIKAMIDKGARDGQRRNFEALHKVLAEHTTVTEPGEVAEAPAPAATAAEAAPAAAAPAPTAAAPVSALEEVVGSAICRQLQPWAAWLHGHLAALSPMLGEVVQPPVLLGVLSTLCLLAVLRLVIDMLLFVQHASAHPRDTIGHLTHYIFKVVDVPESMHKVLLSCLIFYTVRLLVNRLAAALPGPPSGGGRRSRGGGRGASMGGPLPVGAAGAEAAVTGAGALPTRSEEQEAEGVKYEGYAEAIAAAQNQPLSPSVSQLASTADSAPAPLGENAQRVSAMAAAAVAAATAKQLAASSAAAATAAAAKQQAASDVAGSGNSFMKTCKDFTKSFAPSAWLGVSADAGEEEASQPTGASPSPGISTPNGPAAPEGSKGASKAAPAAVSAGGGGSTPSSPPPQAPLAAAAPGLAHVSVGSAAAALVSSPGHVSIPPRSLSDSEALAGTTGGAVVSPPDGGHVPRSQTGLLHAKSAGALAEQSGGKKRHLARKLMGVLSPSGQPSSPREPGSSEEGPALAALSEKQDKGFSPTAAQRDFRSAMPAHLAPALATEAIIEEVFENERLQPFRGWGHTWPGHFLPTDKVNHWSRREHEGFPLLTGLDFNAIAPPLPEGWQWCEEKWHLDRSGQIIDACDADGWAYGLDFGYVKHPFQANSGKKKMSDFVRRRRWIRTRVPLALAGRRRATAIAEDSSSWSEAVVGEEAQEGGPGSVSRGWTAGSEAAAAAKTLTAPATAAAAAAAATGRQEGSEQKEVQAEMDSTFDQVEARSSQEIMAEALSQRIGSSSSRNSHDTSPQHDQQAGFVARQHTRQEEQQQQQMAALLPGLPLQQLHLQGSEGETAAAEEPGTAAVEGGEEAPGAEAAVAGTGAEEETAAKFMGSRHVGAALASVRGVFDRSHSGDAEGAEEPAAGTADAETAVGTATDGAAAPGEAAAEEAAAFEPAGTSQAAVASETHAAVAAEQAPTQRKQPEGAAVVGAEDATAEATAVEERPADVAAAAVPAEGASVEGDEEAPKGALSADGLHLVAHR